MATNLALQLQVIEPDTDLNSIMIGNSRYSDDIWDLRPFIISKNLDLSKTSLRFRYISDTDMKETVKQYTYYKLGKTKPQTVRDYINAKLPMFIEYCSINGIIHKVFINGLVKNAIAELTEHTAELRKESGLKELFLCRIKSQNNKIAPYTETHWNDKKLRYFIERHDIRDNKGDLYPLTSHQFRSTFVRELIKRKVPIAMIMKQYSHVSIEMTAHYLTLQEEEVKEIYSDMILSPESKIAGLRAKEIKGKLDDLFHGKTEDEIDDVISGLAKTMSFNPLPTGVCLYDFRRGNCTDGDGCFFYNCPNYITEVQFYPILKDELDLLEKEMVRLKELGQEPAYQVQAVKYKYLKPLVESLEVQLNGKESVG